jgi:hypothetical protein
MRNETFLQVRKTASFLEFSLCLSRACLGKMIVFIYKWLKNAVFFAGGMPSALAHAGDPACFTGSKDTAMEVSAYRFHEEGTRFGPLGLLVLALVIALP